MATREPVELSARHLTIGHGAHVVLEDVGFDVHRGDVFVIMGGSGSGKSTLLRHLIGLQQPMAGEIRHGDIDLARAGPEERERALRRSGVLFQSGALWTSMTAEENVMLPLTDVAGLGRDDARALARLKLALVGLKGAEALYPRQLSGGMQKRAAVARAIALDPELLFLDEPSAGLDPPTSRRMDELILELRDSLGVTVVVVTHELASIYAIGNSCIFIDGASRAIIARGDPRELRERSRDERVRDFLGRGDAGGARASANGAGPR